MKHFYFPFYTDAFTSGTSQMTCEEVGAYIRLLVNQFDKGKIPKDLETIQRLCGTQIDLKFVLNKFPNGKNKKMSEVMAKLQEKSKKSKDAVDIRWQYGRNTDAIPYKDKVKDKDKEDKDIRGSRNFVAPTLTDVDNFNKELGYGADPQYFIDFYESKGWLVGKSLMKDWRSAYRRSKTWGKDKPREYPKYVPTDDGDPVPPPKEVIEALKSFKLRSI